MKLGPLSPYRIKRDFKRWIVRLVHLKRIERSSGTVYEKEYRKRNCMYNKGI